jgi:aryl-alcohol dehydrogenase-like predicted oxidoreductase
VKYRRLGSTNLTVSVIGVGTWQFGGEWGKDFEQAEVDAMFDQARDLGINLVDTAECYGDHTSESLVGAAIRRDRGDWVVATKFGHRYHGLHERTDHGSPGEVREQLEESLRALETEYVDVYQFHSGPDDVFDQDELWEMLRNQVAAGKIRYLGVSPGSNTDLYQTDRSSDIGSDVMQVVYSRLDREPEEAVLPSCQRQDLGVPAREALAGGLLTGKYRPGTRFTNAADTRSRRPTHEVDRRLEAAQRIREEEVPEGTPMAAWALAWCLQHPAVTAVIPGGKSSQQIAANAKAAELTLVAADHRQAVAP